MLYSCSFKIKYRLKKICFFNNELSKMNLVLVIG